MAIYRWKHQGVDLVTPGLPEGVAQNLVDLSGAPETAYRRHAPEQIPGVGDPGTRLEFTETPVVADLDI